MNYQESFPKVLERTYSNLRDVSTANLPKIKARSFLFGERIISLPFLDIINIERILNEDLLDEGEFEIRISEGNKNIELIRKTLTDKGFKEKDVKGHIVSELTDEENFWERFHKHTRNDIRKAEKSELAVKRIYSKQELENFYNLYLTEMKNFGTPQHSFRFFENCKEIMKESFVGWNCYNGEHLIGSIILFLNKDYAYVPFNVSDGKFRASRPNDILYWEAIKWCIKNRIKFLDLGQIDLDYQKNSREESLLKFKRKWLGKEYRRIYFTRGFSIDSEKKGRLKRFRVIWKRLPKFVIKFFGPKFCSQLV